MINRYFYSLASKLWPELESMSEQRRLVGLGDVLTFLYVLPFTLVGLIWLLKTTDPGVIAEQLPNLALIFFLIILFSQVTYFIIVEIRTDRYGSTDGSLANMILLSGVLLFGASAIWTSVLWSMFRFGLQFRHAHTFGARWSQLRNVNLELASNTLALLIAFIIYERLGGSIPIASLSRQSILPALGMLIIHFILVVLLFLGFVLYHIQIQTSLTHSRDYQPLLTFFALSFGLPYLAHPFAILAAGLYVQNGLGVYLFFLVGLLMVAYLARQLSYAVENSRQRSRQLEQLESLGRAILSAPPDPAVLPDILNQHIPNMFPSGHISIWLAPDQLLYHYPEDWPALPERTWKWVVEQTDPRAVQADAKLPWENQLTARHALVSTPIFDTETNQAIGGICLELRALVSPWDQRSLEGLFPAMQTLAAQIASALHQAELYEQMLAYQNVTQELRLAGKIQASFLPNQFPVIPGWQLAVTLLPARETSGDFFDVIQLSGGRLGILIADVADKGVGPALYMALSRTLLRTYAVEYDAEPEVVFFAANNRLLKDARANLFVTVFYGILDPVSGELIYCNAGHNPPYLVCADNHGSERALGRTGIAMGIDEEATWTQASVTISAGDVLILYTDGIPDAQNCQGMFFDDETIIEVVRSHQGESAHEIQSAILESVQQFAGDEPQFDDITLMVLERDR
jgi:serine phosphatase RsbU (regulator of sigma subunit)